MNAWPNNAAALAAALMLLAATAGQAQGPDSNRIVLVPASGALVAALNEAAGLLAIGDRGPDKYGRLSLYPLDAHGQPGSAEPVRVPLAPFPAAKDKPLLPLGLAFHPTLPLLYLWQDLREVKHGAPLEKAVLAELDHLIVFAVTPGALTPVFHAARGPMFAFGQTHGSIALDPAGRRLFLPNLRAPGERKAAIGYYDLGTNGLPLERDGELALGWIDVSPFRDQPTGLGFVPVSHRVVLFSGPHGPAAWDTENRLAPLNALPLLGVPARENLVAGHPSLPIVYGAGIHGLFGMEHAGGFPTQLPWKLLTPNASFLSPPTVMSRPPAFLAVGGKNHLWFAPLDAAGRFTGPAESMPVNDETVRALVYSARFDRLYVAVEKTP
jgi:hypothetical protein